MPAGPRGREGPPDASLPLRGEIEFRDLVVLLWRHACAQSCFGAHRSGTDRGARRRNGLGQVDLDQPARAPARTAAGHGVRRWRGCPRHPACASCAGRSVSCPRSLFFSRIRVGDNVAFGFDALTGQSGQARAGGRGGRRACGAYAGQRSKKRRRLPGWTKTSPNSRRASTRWSASAGSRSPAARNSGRRSPAPSSSIRRILILDDALSAVDTYTEEEILSRLRVVMRQRTSIIVSHRISTVRDADQIFVLDRGAYRGTRRARRADPAERACTRSCTGRQLLEEELAAS